MSDTNERDLGAPGEVARLRAENERLRNNAANDHRLLRDALLCAEAVLHTCDSCRYYQRKARSQRNCCGNPSQDIGYMTPCDGCRCGWRPMAEPETENKQLTAENERLAAMVQGRRNETIT
jgi:hypothetical protein